MGKGRSWVAVRMTGVQRRLDDEEENATVLRSYSAKHRQHCRKFYVFADNRVK